MIKVVGIAFKEVGKIYWFNPGPYKVEKDDRVVVETVRGLELGMVVIPPLEIEDGVLEHELKPVVRIASNNDLKTYKDNVAKAEKSFVIAEKIIAKNKLEMKLLECEYTLDKQKVIFYYNADGRVDFRELLKDLAQEFKVRIELRQVGSREGAKILGGIGVCGREICCKNHLREFDLVTMKMAKDQGMSLNASKVAGVCGKLMCCIAYENPLYEEIRKRIPLNGDVVETPDKKRCKVIDVNILQEIIKTIDDEEKIEVWEAKDLVKIESRNKEENDILDKELLELEDK